MQLSFSCELERVDVMQDIDSKKLDEGTYQSTSGLVYMRHDGNSMDADEVMTKQIWCST